MIDLTTLHVASLLEHNKNQRAALKFTAFLFLLSALFNLYQAGVTVNLMKQLLACGVFPK